MAITIGSIGHNHRHEKGFFSELPDGPGACLFLLIKSPALFTIKGKTYSVSENSYVMLNSDTPCTYRSFKGIYIDDWFYFNLDKEDRDFFSSNNIVFDQPEPLNEIEDLSSLIHQIAYELFSADPYHKEIQNNLSQIFFYKLARVINSKNAVSPDVLASKNEKLTYLRSQLFQNPLLFSNIDEMADFMNLSRSGFQHLYNSVFGHSVIKDVISGRIEFSKDLLANSKYTISEIAAKCGYRTEYHFMRQFKQITGFTPTEYRKSDIWNQINFLKKS